MDEHEFIRLRSEDAQEHREKMLFIANWLGCPTCKRGREGYWCTDDMGLFVGLHATRAVLGGLYDTTPVTSFLTIEVGA